MDKYLKEALAAGLICPSSSPEGAGFFVEKKDETLRPCIDYQALNNITVKNRYPLPLMSSAFELLQGAWLFSKLDLRNTYHLVRIREGDEWKTAFNTTTGHWEYQVMLFGHTNAPAVFQTLVNDVLCDMINQFVFVYIDDILIFSRTPEEHTRHVRMVLKRLLENQLHVKAEKCEYSCPKTSFLGFIIDTGNIQMDSEKVEAVTEWPNPTDHKSLQRYLGTPSLIASTHRPRTQSLTPFFAPRSSCSGDGDRSNSSGVTRRERGTQCLSREPPAHPRGGSITGPPVGSLVPAFMPPWRQPHHYVHPAQVLVAPHFSFFSG